MRDKFAMDKYLKKNGYVIEALGRNKNKILGSPAYAGKTENMRF